MNRICRELQERVALDGAQALRDDAAAQRHLAECTECFEALEGLAQLDEALGSMPALEPSERVVEELLARVGADPADRPADFPRRRWLDSLAALARPRFILRDLLLGMGAVASVAFASFLLLTSSPSGFRRDSLPEPQQPARLMLSPPLEAPASGTPAQETPGAYDDQGRPSFAERAFTEGKTNSPQALEKTDELRALGYVDDGSNRKPEAQADLKRLNEEKTAEETKSKVTRDATVGVDLGVEGGVPGGVVGGELGGIPDVASPAPVRVGGQLKAPKLIRQVAPTWPEIARGARVEGVVILEIVIGTSGKVAQAKVLRSVPLLDAAALEAVKQWVYAPTLLNGRPVPVIMTVTIAFRLSDASPTPSSDRGSEAPAEAFLAERATTGGLPFQPGKGYWANTYLPGDPALRVLRARLLEWDRSALQAGGVPVRLHDAASPVPRPFDPPRHAALALYLQADTRGLDGPRRMLVQVGLKGAPRPGGARPPMSLALVLDLRGDVPVEVAAGLRALALAFAEASSAGDRFSLIVAGRPGGLLVGPGAFRHGPVSVAFDRVLAANAPTSGAVLDLGDAVAEGFREACHRDAFEATLGSSAVVLATGQRLGDAAATLADLAHQGALAGIPMSVVGVGGGASVAELDRLALAGQGSRRQLAARSDAAAVADAELYSASDVVARAVRLRIRLAPGVRLVEVVGSRRLDEAQAQRVREAERSIDLRLARELGLEADRGEDEDGIQIVIPAFHAGDSHVVLLDVVAPGAGRVADVSVRYKDVVLLRNDAARASLSVPAGTPAAGPLERNVLKNLLDLRLVQALTAAASDLDRGDAGGAAGRIEQACALRRGLAARLPGLAGDPDLSRDVAMLQEYAQVLSRAAAVPSQLAYLADSLRYAGRLKQLGDVSAGGVLS